MALKLNLGSGDTPIAGWTNLDRKNGQEIYPLDYEDGSVDVIRASHVLEHFSHTLTDRVIADWVRALKPGGELRIAVPDFEAIAEAYLQGKQLPIEGYVMGGHVDENDHHGALFDQATLVDALHRAGLIAIRRWNSDQSDCASLPISLNLAGYKPPSSWPVLKAVMSSGRLGFNDFWTSAIHAFQPLGIGVQLVTGAFWEQCLTRGLENSLAEGCEYVITLDYDTVFCLGDVETLIMLMMRYRTADAISALQVHRRKPTPLMTMHDEDGKPISEVPWETFSGDLSRCATTHFGLTIFRASKLASLPCPWLHGLPDEQGRWGENRTDPDISFWRAWEHAGNTLYQANRVPVGHLELMIRWPGRDLHAIHQNPQDYWVEGKPKDVWR